MTDERDDRAQSGGLGDLVRREAETAAPHHSYQVGLSPEQVREKLEHCETLRVYTEANAPNFGNFPTGHAYTVQLVDGGFRIHTGIAAGRGSSGTGMRRLLHVEGRVRPLEEGSSIELRFSMRRPRWAWQRWFGLLGVSAMGAFWVATGGAQLGQRALLFALFLGVVLPTAWFDFQGGKQLEAKRKRLLALMDGLWGPETLGAGMAPYRDDRSLPDRAHEEPDEA